MLSNNVNKNKNAKKYANYYHLVVYSNFSDPIWEYILFSVKRLFRWKSLKNTLYEDCERLLSTEIFVRAKNSKLHI